MLAVFLFWDDLEYAKLIARQSYLIKGRTIAFTIEYTANVERELYVQVNKGNFWVGKSAKVVAAGIHQKTQITIVSNERIDPGEGYKMKLILHDVGADWENKIDKNVYKVSLHKLEY